MKAGGIYTIDLQSKKFDTLLIVRDADGKQLAVDDDGGEGLNSRLMFVAPQDGMYKLVVTAFGGRGAGEYTLTVTTEEPAFSTKGKLTGDDPMDRVRKDSHSKTHEVKLEGGKAYIVYLMSKSFDPYLRVEDAEGKSLGENDDGGGGLNSKLMIRPEKGGMFKIIATSFAGGQTGDYLVSVQGLTKEELLKLDPSAALIGEPAPNLTGHFSYNGETKSLADLKGKVVLLDFWAVWCGPCIKTFPHLRDWSKEFKKEGLEVLGVTTYFKQFDFDKEKGRLSKAEQPLTEKEENAMLQQFTQHHKLDYRIMAVSQDDWQKASRDYGVRGIPTAVLIDRQGKVRMIRVGSGEENARALESEIKRLIAEK
jgi:thiol-disulfide isomerase/thioredoxin